MGGAFISGCGRCVQSRGWKARTAGGGAITRRVFVCVRLLHGGCISRGDGDLGRVGGVAPFTAFGDTAGRTLRCV